MTRVALSFDNGPDPDVTPAVLDVLRDRGVPAQFYVLGKWLADPRCRRLVERARDEGHTIGNHSFGHAVPLGEDPRPDAVAIEIAATEALLAPLWPGARRFRPFGGGGVIGRHLLSPGAVDYLVAHRYSCILWNSVPRDWIDPGGWPARALADCAEAYSDSILHVTTRQDIQLHYVHIEETPSIFRRLAAVGITTREACGNTVRNVTGCPLAGATDEMRH